MKIPYLILYLFFCIISTIWIVSFGTSPFKVVLTIVWMINWNSINELVKQTVDNRLQYNLRLILIEQIKVARLKWQNKELSLEQTEIKMNKIDEISKVIDLGGDYMFWYGRTGIPKFDNELLWLRLCLILGRPGNIIISLINKKEKFEKLTKN
jgi:hypothetical protein